MKLSLSFRATLALLALIVAMVVMATAAIVYSHATRLETLVRDMATNTQLVRAKGDLDLTREALRADVLQALVTTDAGQREQLAQQFAENRDNFSNALQILLALTKETPLGNMVKAVEPDAATFLSAGEQLVELSRKDAPAAIAGRAAFIDAFGKVKEGLSYVSDLVEKRNLAAQTSAAELVAELTRAVLLTGLSGLLIILVAATAAYRLIRRSVNRVTNTFEEMRREADLTREVPAMAGELRPLAGSLNLFVTELHDLVQQTVHGARAIAESASQVSAGSGELSARTEEQASTLEETASSMEELASTVRENAGHSHTAADLARRVLDMAEDGGRQAEETSASIRAIQTHSANVGETVKLIETFAFQTNILALNAAVEAARAGEQGRGFAVVAAEVRSLAQRSAAAAKEIRDLVAASNAQVEQGVERGRVAAENISRIVTAVHELAQLIAEVSRASNEQAQGVEQVNSAVAQLESVTQHNAAAVEQSASAAESMQQEANRLRDLVARFKLRDGTTPNVKPARASVTPLRGKRGESRTPESPSLPAPDPVRIMPRRPTRRS